MNPESQPGEPSRNRDGFAAGAITILTVLLIALVVSKIV